MDLEIIINLWYVRDQEGIIYSLRARPYVVKGSEAEKAAYLKKHAKTDYLIAQAFPVPQRYRNTVIVDGTAQDVPIAHVASFNVSGQLMALFEDVFVALNNQLPAQTSLSIGEDPFVFVTPLLGHDSGFVTLYPSEEPDLDSGKLS